MTEMRLRQTDPLAFEITRAVKDGDVASVQRLLDEYPGLASARIEGRRGGSRTVLHQVADWPGQFPNAPEVARILVHAGADVDAATEGSDFAETPLHWTASSDDFDVAAVLLDLGADIEATHASIAGGTALDNAVGYGCWRVAYLLVARGARVDKLWHAAALGLLERVEELTASASAAEINQAFFHACAGAQQRAAAFLLARGADINYVPEYSKTTPLGAAIGLETRRQTLADWLKDRGARES